MAQRAMSTGKRVSYDEEALAILIALGELTADSEFALASIIDTSIHSSQSGPVSACRIARTWLQASNGHVRFHWSPNQAM